MDDLKQMWQQYDQRLQQSQYFNERMLRKLNARHAKSRISKMLGVEISGIVVLVISLGWLLIAIGRIKAASGLISGCYWLVILVLLLSLVWSLWKAIFISALDSSKLAVTEMLHRMTRLRLLLVRERLWGGIIALIFLVVPSIVVLTFMLTGIDMTLTNRSTLIVQTAIVLLVGTPVGLWVYRRYYFDSIDEIMENLREIKQFEDASQP